MLPACSRMRKRREFEAAVRRGRRAGRRLLVAHLGAADDTDSRPRVGFVVSRAVGNAPTRNRVRRRLRHLMADRLEQLPEQARLVVRVLPAAASASFADLSRELDALIDRLVPRHDGETASR